MIRKIFKSREFYLLVLIIALILFIGLKSEYFFTMQNFRAFMLSVSVYGIIASALTVVFISGGFDMSVGSTLSFLGVVLGILLLSGIPVVISIILILIFGTLIGFSMGLIVAKLGVTPFIVSISYFFIFLGLSFFLGYTSELRSGYATPQFTPFPESFNRIAGGNFFGIEYIVFYLVAIVIIFQILTTKNVFFRQNYFLGSNEKAAKAVGIKVIALKIFNYTLVGVMVSITTILRASRVGATTAGVAGTNFPLTIIAAIILGGGSLTGGTGSVLGSFLGVLFLSLLTNLTILLGVNTFYNTMLVGIVLILSVFIDYIMKGHYSKEIKKT